MEPMKVLMLNTYDGVGGAAIAAFRLLQGIRAQHIDGHMLVQFKGKNSRELLCIDTPVRKMAKSLKLFLELQPAGFYPNKPYANFTPALLPDRLVKDVASVAPDIIHLHWLASGFMRLETLRKLKKPLIWTLHDSWAFTGGCHIPFACHAYQRSCGACPVLGSSSEKDLSRWIWRRKEKAWRDLNLTVVTPSRWMADCAKSSSLFRDLRVEVIPNGLDLSLYRPVDRQLARELLQLPQRKKLILFGAAHGTDDRNKGFDLLQEALKKISARWEDAVELVVIGASLPSDAPPLGMKAHYLGRLQDDLSLVLSYAAADVFVAPSRMENLSNMVMEAMACGTPCVAFNQGGMPDLVEHGRTGYLAQPFDVDDLAQKIDMVLEDDAKRQEMSENARYKVEKEFSLDIVANRYACLYRELL